MGKSRFGKAKIVEETKSLSVAESVAPEVSVPARPVVPLKAKKMPPPISDRKVRQELKNMLEGTALLHQDSALLNAEDRALSRKNPPETPSTETLGAGTEAEEEDEELDLLQEAGQKLQNVTNRWQGGGVLLGKIGVRERLRMLRERLEPVIESRFGQHHVVVQKLDVVLRGGRPRPFALVGPSGTGKSFRALLFAENHNIPFLIDDGILIEGGRIVAGCSAKNELVYIKAIKTALFDEPEHLTEVRRAIREHKVQRILLVGTSVKMVRMIAERLGLPKIADSDITYIEEISSPEEIRLARKSRYAGHHIIPVPAVEVSREYGNLIRDGFQVFLSDLRMGMKHYLKQKIKKRKGHETKVFEKTVVKPQFMKKVRADQSQDKKTGRIQMTESALRQMICHCIDEYNQGLSVARMKIRISRTSYKVKVFIRVPLAVIKAKGTELNSFLYKLQNYVVNSLHRYAGVVLEELNIEVLEFV